jgi:hypothetical protein
MIWEKFFLISYFCFDGISSVVVVRALEAVEHVVGRRLVGTKGSENYRTIKGLGLNWAFFGTK